MPLILQIMNFEFLIMNFRNFLLAKPKENHNNLKFNIQN